MLTGSYKSRERKLEHQLSADEIASARGRRDRFIAACRKQGVPVFTATVHRCYVEALEEVARGDVEEPLVHNPYRYEQRSYAQVWQMMDWPT